MKQKEPLTINLNVDWRVLAVLGIAVCFLVLAFSAARAQDSSNPPNINELQEEASVIPSGQASEPVELQCSEGLLPTTNDECVSPDTLGVNPDSAPGEVASAAIGGGGHHFYLTSNIYIPSNALSACASGYHMASLWEILDVSNLTYDYDHPAAYTQADSGYGPPAFWNGWVRTGYLSSGVDTAGTGNCLNWSDATTNNYGVSVRLTNAWETAPGDIFTWDTTSYDCFHSGPVWCVGN